MNEMMTGWFVSCIQSLPKKRGEKHFSSFFIYFTFLKDASEFYFLSFFFVFQKGKAATEKKKI